MIQIMAIREYPKDDGSIKKKTKLLKQCSDITDIFKNPKKMLDNIASTERYNIFYSVSHCKDPRAVNRRLRIFESQDLVPFDIDGIDVKKIDEYRKLFFKTTSLNPKKTAQVFTGNGLHFICKMDESFTETTNFKFYRPFYKAIKNKLDLCFSEHNLPGEMDTVVWKEKSLMRFPETENRKPKKSVKMCRLLQGNIEEQKFDWHLISGIEKIKDDFQIKNWNEKTNSTLDETEILKECGFIKWVIKKPEEVREPHFYAASTILARMPKGREKVFYVHRKMIEAGSDSSVASYTKDQVDKKIDASLETTGPRTCKGISDISDKCLKCPHFKKISSPVVLKAKEFISTKNTGFCYTTEKGKHVAVPSDLRLFFDEQHAHITMEKSGIVYRYENGHYKFTSENYIKAFAQDHYLDDVCNIRTANEFLNLIKRTNLKDESFFTENCDGYLNFPKGVLDIKKGSIIPHSPDFGFRYVLPYDYDPEAQAPNFRAFLDDVMDGDQERISILEEFGGYAIAGGRYKYHKFLMLSGNGRNGKGTFVDVLKKIVGKDNFSSVDIPKMKDPNFLQLMEGKLFNFSDEVGNNDLRNSSILKNITGEGLINVKMMWYQPYSIESATKIIMACNELPIIEQTNYAIRDRLLLVEFDKNYTAEKGNVDFGLKDKLTKELPGILNILLNGYKRLETKGSFSKSKRAEADAEEYMLFSNEVLEWLNETGCVKVYPLDKDYPISIVEFQSLFIEFCLWYRTKSEQEYSYKMFTNKLKSAIPDLKFRKSRLRVGECQKTFYKNMTLNDKAHLWGEIGTLKVLKKEAFSITHQRTQKQDHKVQNADESLFLD